MKRRKLLSILLAAGLLLGLASHSLAVGKVETVIDEGHNVMITFESFLRKDTHRYSDHRLWTFYVVADNSTVTVEAMPGCKYVSTEEDRDNWYLHNDRQNYAGKSSLFYEYDCDTNSFGGVGSGPRPLSKPMTYTITPSTDQTIHIDGSFSAKCLCESDFSRLVPFEGKPKADDWAIETLENAYDARLFPYELDPFDEDCTRDMTRLEFIAVAVNLYEAMGGDDNHRYTNKPAFMDLADDRYTVYAAYNYGITCGTSETTFSPDAPLTREQAAVMLWRIYTKLRNDAPNASVTHFVDAEQISPWAKQGVALMVELGIAKSASDGRFTPQRPISIQEAVSMAQQMLENT